jgi:glyoxylate reductase
MIKNEDSAPQGRLAHVASTRPIRVLVTYPLLPIARAEFEKRFAVEEAEPSSISKCVSEPDVVLVGPTQKVGMEYLNRLPASVSAIATYSVGLDHVNLDAIWAKGLALFNTPIVLSNAVADHAMLLILAVTRRVTESTTLLRNGHWIDMQSNQILGIELAGRTLGIFGMGDIGGRVACRAAAFGMRVIYHNRKPAKDKGVAEFVHTIEELLSQSDILLLSSPSTPETHGFINNDRLEKARDGIIIVNISRGDLIDDGALLAALDSGKVRGAALDVFRDEPRVDPRYLALPNTFLTPHIGSATEEARRGMAATLCDAIETWQRGKRPANQVV